MSESQHSESTHQGAQPPHLRVFLCHAHEDKDAAVVLYERLYQDGFQPWMDKKDLLPGEDWEHEIKCAVRDAHVFLVCVSHYSATKAGFVNREILFALEVAEQQPERTIFIIPVRLEDTAVPDRVSRWHWCNYFEPDGHDLLVRALRKRAKQLGIALKSPTEKAPATSPPPPSLPEPVRKLVAAVENPKLPAAERVEAGRQLADLGDPRPGVCTLPPAMVRIEGGRFVIGNPREQAKYDDEINDQPMTVATFELARYPITNAQYKLFIDDGGYKIDAPWWNEAAREWLQQNGIQEPRLWNDNRFGIARPNHPVVGISWYEAVAFCRWLTLDRRYNPESYIAIRSEL